jgi:murein DD-endopeptidase MepM/ murein hydrolase activator NlpD
MRARSAILAGLSGLTTLALLVPAMPVTGVPGLPGVPGVQVAAAQSGGSDDADDDASDEAAERAAREITAARNRANAAAEALFQAESDLDALDLQRQALESDISVLQDQIAALRESVEMVAISRFARTGTDSMPLLTGFRSATEQAQVDVLIDVVNETSAQDFDDFDALNSELEDTQDELRRTRAEAEAARDALEQRREDAEAEIERLKEIEEQRLQDEAVRKALEAQQAERRRQEQAAADAMRAEAAALDTVGQQTQLGSGTVPTTAPPVTTVPGVSTGASAVITDDIDDIDSAAPVNQSTGGTGGGLTGVTGAGARPGALAGDLAGPGWVCPVQGHSAFADTWGQARSGGRSHQGVDMIATRGTPLVAVVDGFAQSKVNTLGGNTVALTGADGNRYYYAHLDSWATLGQVTAGTIIGYVGDTGNAKYSTPHLHFEIRPGGGAAVNPYATVRNRC